MRYSHKLISDGMLGSLGGYEGCATLSISRLVRYRVSVWPPLIKVRAPVQEFRTCLLALKFSDCLNEFENLNTCYDN